MPDINNLTESAVMDFSRIEIVYDHADFLVINKPAGVSVHKDDQKQGLVGGLAEFLKLPKLYLVHRLDKMTSGLLILAKTEDANRMLSGLFQQRAVSKYYLALSDKKPKKKQGLIKGDMVKGRGGSWMLVKKADNPAITQFFSFSVADCFQENEQSKPAGLRLFVLKPHTGKTHQLRVAMKSLGAPILGDARYYPKPAEHNSSASSEARPEIDRGYLHAWRLSFTYQKQSYDLIANPSSGKYFCHEHFDAYLNSLGHPKYLAWPTL
ncbi:TIGR01621 family pseudouridine synthase [Litoribrevibacter euphylliae]|uniref:TIGR01621 family pseudouridine synthase n=1 Tax=Litoribrevibacter euphylliae TaxID=1834034 RepID=A0ABV7H6W5_9GAMM